ncbi:proline-rich protein 36-like isoform X2 [Chiroxiphia lanceolata]|uniref:proline-rich protein 36-like isoform X2 n=1 Tax=Chiroxiphia lanceolata TaxID=296741 RepID=UPI0013CED2E7|nr:proline-rich protein 36-like isoform X2 [Chiroxiphia lanceolata]
MYFLGMTQELLHEMQEKLPIFVLIAAGLLDLSGASRSERDASDMLALGFPGWAQPRAESSPVPSEGFPGTEDNSDGVTFHFQSPAADPTKATTADSSPAATGRAANGTALLPGGLAGTLEVAEPLHTETAASKPQGGHAWPGQLLGSFSIPVSTQGSQAATALEQPGSSLQRRPGDIPGAGPSSAAGLPQPPPSAGPHQDSPPFTAVPSLSLLKQMEVTKPKTSPLISTVRFHPPGKGTAASPSPSRAGVALGGAGLGWSPTGMHTNPQAQPGSTAALTPARLERTQGMDAGVTASAVPPQPAPGGLDAAYSSTTHARATQLSPGLPLKEETTGSKGRNSTAAVTNGSGHPTQLPALQTLPPGHVHSSSFLMGSPVPGGLIPSPVQGPFGTTGGQQPLSLDRALNCTKPVAQESNRSSQGITVVALQGDADHGMVTSKPGKSLSPENPQASATSSSLSPSRISTLKLSQTTKEQKEGTSAPSPGISGFWNADLQPWDSVQEGLQPPGASFPARAGLQPMGIPSSAERLHTTTTLPPAPGSGSQGVPAHPVPREAFAVTLQVSTGEDSKRRKGLPQQTAGTVPASPVPSPSGARESRTQAAPWHSSAPAAPQSQHSGSLAAPAPAPPSPRAGGSQPSSATAHPDPGVPREGPAPLAQALVQQFRRALDAATRNLSTARGDPLTITSTPNLSFLFKSTDGMICLRPLQESPLPRTFPNASVGGLVSVQQILAASNSSALDLADLHHLSPSSLVLVRPVFILLPTDRAHSPFPRGEGDHRTTQLGTHVGTPESSHGSSSYPTSKSETTLSTASNQQAERAKVTPQPTHPSYRATTGLGQAASSAPGPLLDPGMGMSSTGQTLHLPRIPEEMQIPAPPSQEAKSTDSLLLSRMLAEPGTSPGAPSVLPTKQSPHTSPKVSLTTEKPHSVTPLLPAKGLLDFPVPAQPVPSSTGAAGHAQHSGTLQTAPPGQGSGTTPSSAPAPCVECGTSRSAAATKHPLKGLTSTKPLQATSQGLPRTTQLPSVVPSTSSASPVLPAGNEHGEAALGSTAPSGGVPVPATAAQTHSTSVQPDLPHHLEFTPMVPKPFVRTEGPTAAPVQAPFPTEIQRNSAARPPSPAPAHVPLLAALEGDQALQAPTELFPRASAGETPKPTELSTRAGKAGPSKSSGVSVSLSAPVNTQTQHPPPAALGKELGSSAAQPSVPTGSALQRQPRGTRGTPQAAPAVTALSAAQGAQTTAPLTSKKGLHLPTPAPQPDPSVVLPGVNTPAVGKGEGEAKGEAAPTSHLPTQAPLSASPRHPLEKEILEDTMEQEPGHSSPGSALSATGPPPTAALAVSAGRPGNKVTNHSAALQRAAGSDAEMLPARDPIQLLPSPESPSHPAGSPVALPAREDSLLAVAGTDSSEGLLLNTEAEEMGRTEEVTDGAAEGLVTVVTLLDAQPSAPGDSHHRRGLQPELAVLDGLAVVRDDACGSGNYTVQLSLSPAADTAPEPHGPPAPSPETFLALVAVQDNLSQPLVQPLLQIHSCCVTPSASPGAPGAQCCLFRRLPFECRHIQLLQSSRSRAASFTIQLFQMLNHSVAYLHCELDVCLHGKAGCEQDCLESVEPVLQPSDRNSPGNLHNLISFGPVWRMKDGFLYKPVEGPGSAVLLPILLGSLTGFAVLGSAFISLWLHHRQKSKPLHYPPFGDIHGL